MGKIGCCDVGLPLNFVAAPTPPGAEDQEKRKEFERKQLALAHEWLDQTTDGDHETIGELLFSKHPGYATNPELSTEQFLKKLEEK